MRNVRFVILFLLLAGFGACEALFVDSDAENSPVENFELLWREFDRYYSYFTYKNVDWGWVYEQYRPQISDQTPDQELFAVFSAMLEHLKDGHVNLFTPFGIYVYDAWWSDYPANFYPDVIRQNYLGSSYRTAGEGVYVYGKLTDDVGYLRVTKFGGSQEAFEEISRILEEFRDMKAMVVDVRHNGGGSSNNAELVASRFADRRRLFGYVKWRNGPEHDDFTAPQELFIEPAGEWTFSKPVALLTNRRVFSAAEHFVQAMRALPHVTVLGDFTGGGAGNPILRELRSGWVYRLSRWQELTPELVHYEGVGLMPHILVGILEEDLVAGKDTILDAAIATLESLEKHPGSSL